MRSTSISTTETPVPVATHVEVTEVALTGQLVAGRSVSVPLLWYPRLAHAAPEERGRWRFIGRGEGIHRPDLDEDISNANLLAGRPSGGSQRPLKRWLKFRRSAA